MSSKVPSKPAEPPVKGRKASKEVRQQQLIDATLDSLAKRGFAATTMADVADGAGLSRGIVNFHFESKANLLSATLQYLADEYDAHWQAALEKAGPKAADRMRAMVEADFDRAICNKRKLAAWCAFWGEAQSRPSYQKFHGGRDATYHQTLIDLCTELDREAQYGFDPAAIALAINALLEGLWLRLMIADGVTREKALAAANAMLQTVFNKHFPQLLTDAA